MNCKYLKIKLNHKFECKKLHKSIVYNDCANCIYKEYKMHKKLTFNVKKSYKMHYLSTNNVQNSAKKLQSSPKKKFSKMESKSPKLRKLEKNRFSLFTDDLSKCYLCPRKKDHLHEVCLGKNRINSMKYGLVLPLCEQHHKLMHNSIDIQLEYKKRGQELFNSTYPDLNFIDIFHENYLD